MASPQSKTATTWGWFSRAAARASRRNRSRELPVNEALELHGALRDQVHIRTHAAVLNSAFTPRFTESDLEALAECPELLRVAKSHHDRVQLTVLAETKLERNLGAPVYTVPRIFTSTFGRAAIEQVMGHLENLVTGAK